ncbi:MAG TPA: ester cyclase [Candidatus Cybelea sp.]|nr:ester cyclase [Candidatus Cybelea sp.]
MSETNKAIVRRLYAEIWNKHKLELVSEIISPSHALQAPSVSGSAVGPEAYKRQVTLFLAGYPDLRFSIEDTVAENDKVVACWTFSGTHKGDFMGIPPTNKKISVDGMTIHHITGGKIIDSYSNWDALGMMQQLGVVPPLGQAKSLTAR